MSNVYESDFYAWAMEQAALLRARRLDAADIDNIAEEIESMGRGEKRELVNRLAVLLLHLLKWQFQPGFRSPSWSATVREQRIRLRNHLKDNPSLKGKLDESFARGLRTRGDRGRARDGLARERVSQPGALSRRAGDRRRVLALRSRGRGAL